MATLVLTVVGGAIGGPVGAAIGAAIGNQIDQRLFAPKGREGARLDQLGVQAASYGRGLPRLYGRMRVAGTLIWATDLREERQRSGGKGQPKATSYSYSASFAVALSARPIRAVHRIWADGSLLRGAAGDWKHSTGFRLYTGSEDQPVDPLIAAAEGAEAAPAYRGIAYVVFEDLALAAFGNRIPALSFEVEADDAPVTIGAIAADLSDGEVIDQTMTQVDGYVADGASVRGAIEALGALAPLSLREAAGRLALSDQAALPIALAADDLGASTDGKRAPRQSIERRARDQSPDAVAIRHQDGARDGQDGLQYATAGGQGLRTEAIDLPVALSGAAAMAAAMRRLKRLRAARQSLKLSLPWRAIGLRPGDIVTVPGLGPRWRIDRWSYERHRIELGLVAEPDGAVSVPAVASGRSIVAPDAASGATVPLLLDLPPLEDAADHVPRLAIAAAGTAAGWRRAALSLSLDDGASWRAIGETAAPAMIGTVLTSEGAPTATLVQRHGSIDVELLHDGMWLESRDLAAVLAGANAAMLGEELIQFTTATPIGPCRFRLSGLLRGRRGSEAAMAVHPPGTRFALIERESLILYDLPSSAVGSTIRLVAHGAGDGPDGIAQSIVFRGRAIRPPAPVHLRAARQSDGTIRFGWVRRSRTGWGWQDAIDAPLGEESERYRLSIATAAGGTRTIEALVPGYDYAPADQGADGFSGGGVLQVSVAQIGTAAASEPPGAAQFTF